MKLNPDCIRDVLIEVESSQTMDMRGYPTPVTINDLVKTSLTENYSNEDIAYSVKQLIECGYFRARPIRTLSSSDYIIKDITPRGHKFLENIRNTGVWTQTKQKAKGIGSFALDVLSQISASIISSRIGF